MMRAILLHPVRFHRDHRFTRTRASAYLDGELDSEDEARVDAHTHRCPPCAKFVAGLRRTISALGQLRSRDAAASVSDGVLARLREEPDSDARDRRSPSD
jgi:anti-sigma factor RsiW